MAEEEMHIVEMRDDFYRDSVGKVAFIITGISMAMCVFVALSVYLYLSLPSPVTFPVFAEWRVQAPVPVDEPYTTVPDVLQWVSEVIPKSFTSDFRNFNKIYDPNNKNNSKLGVYYTSAGWTVFIAQLKNYVDADRVAKNNMFVNASPTGAPVVVNQGKLDSRYGWWVEMPVDISFTGTVVTPTKSLTLRILVVRVPTLNNLSGVAIDNLIVLNSSGT